jgi:hypothetical protein
VRQVRHWLGLELGSRRSCTSPRARLQLYLPDTAASRARRCNPTCQSLQPYVPDAATLDVLHAATLCTQVTLAEHKPARDAALREVVDLAFAFGSTLPEVSEAILTLTLTLALTRTLILTLTLTLTRSRR